MKDEKCDCRTLRVASDTSVVKLSSSINAAYTEMPERPISVRVIGAGALNQAVKGIIIANKQMVKKGVLFTILPTFQNFDDDTNTAIVLKLKVTEL